MKKSFKHKLLPFAVMSTLAIGSLTGCAAVEDKVGAEKGSAEQAVTNNQSITHAEAVAKIKEENPEIKNVIFLIGDGMGQPYMTAHRYMKDNPKTPEIELTSFDKHFLGVQTTHSEDEKENITDSAAAATAMSGGKKTYNNAIAVDHNHTPIKTVLEQAKENGMSTGLVSTSEITHATPASFGAHDESRKNMDEIADDYYDEKVNDEHKVDVLLGGGKLNFVRDDRDLTKEFKKDGYNYVTNMKELNKNKNEQVLGLFADEGLDKAIDRNKETPSLEQMTNSALKQLSKNDDGFFLMVEGSQIDWAGHDNDIVAAMSEMEDFEKAFNSAVEFAKKDKHTLVVTTADHSTGGFSLGANDEKGEGIYNWLTDPIKAAKKTPDYMAKKIVEGADVEKTLRENIKLELKPEEIAAVKEAAKTGDELKIDDAIEDIFNKRSYTGWTTSGHTGEEVGVYGYGPGKEMFSGFMDNTEQAENIFYILENMQGKDKDKDEKDED
ncbi:alkaline phosphatase [Metabacillus iocasae]|uniref:Alkaline phosphatase n=1 Tax=Priestia iocasae TaxID=2291674 RepID=A0ABS2QY66_9BACI|nr:alkaline phosphatase [Metabacillus iocasae]MBM7704415.1 alkaline phosphatase [Metabacillus iocasae]